MNIQDIQKLYGVLPQGDALMKTMEEKSVRTVFLQGLLASATPMFFASIVKRWQKTMLFVLNDNDEAGYFYNDLKTIAMPENEQEQAAEVLFFPSSYRRAVKYGQRDAGNEILRTEVLSRLSVINEAKVTASLPLCIVTEPSALAELVVAKHKLDEHTLSVSVGQTMDLTETEKTLRSYGFQQVAYVYEPGQFAVRGSILDVYSFSSELPYRIDFFGNDVDTIRTFEVETQLSKDKKEKVEIVPELATLSEEKIPFLQFLPKDSVLVMKDLLYIHDTIERIYNDGFTAQALTEQLEGKTEAEQNELRKQLQANLQLITAQQFTDDALNFKRIEFGANRAKNEESKAIIRFNISPQPLFHKNFELLTQSLKDYLLQGYKLYILADSEKQTMRLRDIFDSKGADSEAETTSVADNIPFMPVNRTIHEGFIDNDLKVCFFTDHQIFDRFHKYSLKSDKARQGKMALTMKELQEMEPGDFLVHVDFGIGKFAGLVRVPAGESYQEMIRLVYQHNDIVDVSIHSLYKISKYRRADSGDAAPRLSVLGSGAWDRLKEKAKKRIKDRLVCGDVGFGKTEVAVRAAFKAATDGKQVAVLVPTTVLAFQHYQTFSKRLKDMPVTVDYLSRARTAKQTKQVLADLAEGKIDILVGTHKLIGKSVKWKDIGLLIIDEEQKFGVSTKEKLRQLKNNIDTLTMSATPIPRTLQFSLMGARDMSIMRTPPPNRYPIQTEIASFSSEVIADAINFEMSRNGQVFFVNDRIANLPELASLIKKYVPDCRVAIGHGQMKPEELEETIIGFMNHDYDVLLSTTIVENGIDISNANTIIINDAHKFGLSDLHQMRGRVGRSNKKAFCYLLAPPLAALNPDARRRLEALETFSDLGSGFSLAMQDLDIRGAGNLLGAEQSGFMEDLGYETYQKILNQAVTELKNDEFQDLYTEEMAEGKELTGDDFIENDADLDAYRKRLEDRFGPVPRQGIELMQVVALRRVGKRLGCEKLILKQSTLQMQFISNPDSAYYKSRAFGKCIDYIGNNPRRCNIKERNGKRSMVVTGVKSVGDAVFVLREIDKG